MKKKIIVNLIQSPDFKALWEVTNITENGEQINSCDLSGLPDCNRLEIGSWLRKNEFGYRKLEGKNKQIQFVQVV